LRHSPKNEVEAITGFEAETPRMQRSIVLPRVIFAGASSDVGKTSIALGVAGALRERGRTVVAAKCGPDFIDTAHLGAVTGCTARNLDAWISGEASVAMSLARSAREAAADIAIIEGVMGLFDGRHGSGDGSSAHVARLLGAPVVLVLDCAKAATTIGAIAYGLKHFDARINVAGAILNRVASDRHAATVRDAVASAGVPVLGVIKRDERLTLPARHLGLVGPDDPGIAATYAALAETMRRDVDLDALLAIASATEPLRYAMPDVPQSPRVPRVRVGLARDEAFWFYDEASLDALRDAGADLAPFSPMRDALPDVDAVFIGGGYPELHAAALAANRAMRTSLRDAIAAGMPVYAECGGLMYLSQALETADGVHEMVGAVPAISTMSARRSALRYVEANANGGPMFAAGEIVRGHEFHYSTTRYTSASPAFAIEGEAEGYASANLHASYVHVHLGSQPSAVARFLG
jgi:cobyrinic acid a,c-diamide synthase